MKNFSDEQVRQIRELWARHQNSGSRLKMAELARKLGIHWVTLRQILIGKFYPDADGPLYLPPRRVRFLDESAREKIRAQSKSGLRAEVIAKQWNISRDCVYRIIRPSAASLTPPE